MSTPQKSGSRTVALREVAKAAGVSPMTVSRVVFDPEKVRPDTREKVKLAIERLGYLPNRLAGGLRTRKTRTVGCVIPSIAIPAFSDLVEGLSSTLAAAGYRLLLATSGYSFQGEFDAVTDLLAHHPEGIVLTGVDHSAVTREILGKRDVPVVEVWDWTETPIDLLVGYSNERAFRTVVAALHARGRRRIAFLGTVDPENGRARARLGGYEAGCRDRGIEPRAIHVAPTIEGGRAGARAAVTGPAAVDAIVCVNDMMAVGAIYELARMGRAVPGDVAVMGFADYEIAGYTTPALTTVRVPRFEIGRRAAELLLLRAAGEPVDPGPIDLGFEIVWRESA